MRVLKGADAAKSALRRLYERTWAEEAAGCSDRTWPQRVALGTCPKRELEERFAELCAVCDELRGAAAVLGLGVDCSTRMVGATRQSIPTHFVVADMGVLAAAVGKKGHYARACSRACRLERDFPHLDAVKRAGLLRKMERTLCDEVDFDLACRAGAWFSRNDASGLTARQVPLAGFHAKWLDAPGRRFAVAQLAGLDALPLVERPFQVRFTYLDPSHLAAHGRRFDSWVAGDVCILPYTPELVVICENRDSALWFPELESAVAVMGDGFAAISNVAALDWVRAAGLVVYWGDMDAAGLEILSGCRQRGLDCESMLMDPAAFERYEAFGTDVDKTGRKIAAKEPLDVPGLRERERELYLRLVDPAWHGPRRIEQERIPLADALAALLELRAAHSGKRERMT